MDETQTDSQTPPYESVVDIPSDIPAEEIIIEPETI